MHCTHVYLLFLGSEASTIDEMPPPFESSALGTSSGRMAFDLKTYLGQRTETQLKNFLVKMQGSRAQLTGSKTVLVTRVEQAAMGQPIHRLQEVGTFHARLAVISDLVS